MITRKIADSALREVYRVASKEIVDCPHNAKRYATGDNVNPRIWYNMPGGSFAVRLIGQQQNGILYQYMYEIVFPDDASLAQFEHYLRLANDRQKDYQ